MAKNRKKRNPDAPQLHGNHSRPVTRREFVAQGFLSGSAFALSGGVMSLFSNPREAFAALSSDLTPLLTNPCNIATVGAGKIPFICFDLAGGANIAGSNVLVGREGGQLDFLSTQGYAKQGLPGDMTPNSPNPNRVQNNFIEDTLGLRFHSDSAFVRGILERVNPANTANINGAVIAARSENDTSNNPHNPMYGIARAGSNGSLLTLIGSRNSDSGGNSEAPLMMIDAALRPTKVDRASMAVALEVRAPFLARDVVEFAFQLPDSFRMRGLTGKRILRDAVRDLLPDSVLRRPKKGFGMPVAAWLYSSSIWRTSLTVAAWRRRSASCPASLRCCSCSASASTRRI